MKEIWTWIKPHIFYFVLFGVGLYAAHAWLAEHDLRMASDAKVNAAQDQIKSLQASAAAQVQQVRTIVVQAKTPAQQIAVIPKLESAPLDARLAPPDPSRPTAPPAAEVDLQPLVTNLLACKECEIKLTECQQESAQKDVQIVALKKKPAFWKRVASTAKVIGISAGVGIAIGIGLGGHL